MDTPPWPPRHATRPLAVLVSGGLDSAVLLAEAVRHYPIVRPMYVSTGSTWEAIEFAHLQQFLAALAGPALKPLHTFHFPVDDIYGDHWSLTGKNVPDENSPDEAVFLPGRNMILLSKALLWCHMNGVPEVAMGPLGANPFPDATPEFYAEMAGVVNRAVGGNVTVVTPYSQLTKAAVIRRAADAPLAFTFSCLRPVGRLHCGHCNKCAERMHAFAEAGVSDPTTYAPRAKPVQPAAASLVVSHESDCGSLMDHEQELADYGDPVPPAVGRVLGVYYAPWLELWINLVMSVMFGTAFVAACVFAQGYVVWQIVHSADVRSDEVGVIGGTLLYGGTAGLIALITWKWGRRQYDTRVVVGEHGLHVEMAGNRKTLMWPEIESVMILCRGRWEDWAGKTPAELDRARKRAYKITGPGGWSVVVNSTTIRKVNRFGAALERHCFRHRVPIDNAGNDFMLDRFLWKMRREA